jgi:hypothetical protein
MFNLERACRVQLAIQSSGQPVNPVPEEIRERTARQYESGDTTASSSFADPYAREWNALLQRLEPATSASYQD